MIILKKFENGINYETLTTTKAAKIISELKDYVYCGSNLYGHKKIGNLQAVVTFK